MSVIASEFSGEAPPSMVVGLVLTLNAAGEQLDALLAQLHARNGLRLGVQQDRWLPVTAETPDPRELHRWLESLAGVLAVDVAYVEIDPEAGQPTSSAGRRRQRSTDGDFLEFPDSNVPRSASAPDLSL